MAVDTNNIKNVYRALMGEAKGDLDEQFDKNRLRGEEYTKVVSATISTAMQQTIHFLLQKPINDAQIASSKADTAIKQAQSAKDLLVKESNINLNTERIASSKADTAIKQAQSAEDLLVKAKQANLLEAQRNKTNYETSYILPKQAQDIGKKLLLLEKQIQKADADRLLVETQSQSIQKQTIDNRKIKAIASLGETFGTQAAGGLTVSADMWSTYFGLIQSLTPISIPSSKAITKVT